MGAASRSCYSGAAIWRTCAYVWKGFSEVSASCASSNTEVRFLLLFFLVATTMNWSLFRHIFRVLKNLPKFYYRHREDVKSYLFRMLKFAGDKENTWRCVCRDLFIAPSTLIIIDCLSIISSAPSSWILKEVEGIVLAICQVTKTALVHHTGVSQKLIRLESLELVRGIVDRWLEDPTNQKNALDVHLCAQLVCNVSAITVPCIQQILISSPWYQILNKSDAAAYLLHAAQDELLPLVFHVINYYASDPKVEPNQLSNGITHLLRAIDAYAVDLEKVAMHYPSPTSRPFSTNLRFLYLRNIKCGQRLPHTCLVKALSTLSRRFSPTRCSQLPLYRFLPR